MGHGVLSRGCAGCSRSALWTESRKRLVLVRDRMGIKPLYYYRRGDDLYFGSELKAILEHPEVPRRLDLEALDYVSFGELCSGAAYADRGNPEGAARGTCWNGGTARRGSSPGGSWPNAGTRRISLEQRRKNSTGCCATRCGSIWCPTCRWESGRRAGWIPRRFCIMPRRQIGGPAEDVLGFVCGAEFRREPVLPRDRAGLRHGPSRVRSESGCGAAERDRGFRLLFGRAERGRGSAAGLVPLADEPAACDGGAFGRRRGRIVRRLSDLSWPDRLARPFRMVPVGLRRLMRGALDRYMPVSDEKISLEYKLKRWMEGSAAASRRSALLLERHLFAGAAAADSVQVRTGNGLRTLVEQSRHRERRVRRTATCCVDQNLLSSGRYSV